MAKNIRDVELFLFDLDGTVYIGDREIEGSFAAVNRLREMGKRICFFTNNSSRMHTDYIARLNHLGLRVWSDEIYTSGQVTCEYLLDNYRGKKVFLLGNDRLRAEFEMYGIELSEDEPDLAVIGLTLLSPTTGSTNSAASSMTGCLSSRRTRTTSVPRKGARCRTSAPCSPPSGSPWAETPTS